MLTLPPLPSWQAIHPLIVHFPIALLMIAPLFVAIGAIRKPERGSPFFVTALILMVIGTLGTFAASSSGDAASALMQKASQVEAVLEQHEELAETTEILFSVLTLIFAAVVFVPKLLKREPTAATSRVLPLVFLMFYATGVIALVNTSHQGGRLVHEFGATTKMQATPPLAVPAVRD